jgi:uncharacterized protein YlaI
MREGSIVTGKTFLSFFLAAVIAALLVFVASPDAYKQGWGYGGGGGGSTPAKYDVVVVVNPVDSGNVTLNPAGGNYYAGTSVTLTAVPEDGYEFSEWGGSITGTENPTIIKVYSGKSITANFVATGSPTQEPEETVEDISGIINESGVTAAKITFDCTACDAVVEIEADTTILDQDNNPTITQLTCQEAEIPSDIPEDVHIVVMADFGPDGTQFSSPVRITMSYDPGTLPEGVIEDSLVVAYYDSDGNWVYLTNIIIDTINHTVSGEIDHFTLFAVLGQVEEEEPVIIEPTSEPTPPSEPVIEPTSEPTPPSEPVIEPTQEPESAPTAGESQPIVGQPDDEDDGDGINPWSIIVPIIVILVFGIGGYIFIQRRRVET